VTAELRLSAALALLRRHGVDFVCIGGVAAIMNGANYVTVDLDICPDASRDNLNRLSNALAALDARIRVDGIEEGLEFAHDGESLGRARIWNLVTNAGELDLCFVPAGTEGYQDIVRDAWRTEVEDQTVLIASLATVIRSKRAADRPKDRLALPVLEARLAEQPDD
jgi:hypothetical protein